MNSHTLRFLIQSLQSGVSPLKDRRLIARSVSLVGVLLVATTVLGTYAPRKPRQPPRRPPTSLVEPPAGLSALSYEPGITWNAEPML
jgi:hypothetical protein